MRINVVVTPKADRDAVIGWKVGADGQRELAIRVTVPPEDGKATKRACKTLARALGVPSSTVSCVRGAASRHKQFEVEGLDTDHVASRLGQ